MGHDLVSAFLKGLAQGSGFIAGMVLTFSAFALALAFLSPVVARWIFRAL